MDLDKKEWRTFSGLYEFRKGNIHSAVLTAHTKGGIKFIQNHIHCL